MLEPCTDTAEAPLASFPSSFPSFKRIPGTRFIVDGFQHAGAWSMSYFLSHFHSDHYTGLTPTWNKGTIFCSQITARLVIQCIKVSPCFVCELPMGEPVEIDSCRVTLVEANHCPGAVQFLFQVPTEKSDVFMRYVHTGDMRYSPEMNADPSLCNFVGADALFLDTTYCNPKFVFPSQNESVSYIAETIFTMREESNEANEGLAHVYEDTEEVDAVCMEVPKSKEDLGGMHADSREKPQILSSKESEILSGKAQGSDSHVEIEEGNEHIADDTKMDMENLMQAVEVQQTRSGATLFLISTYVIGKEKILLAVSKRCNCLIYVNEKKFAILKCLNLEYLDVFTTTPSATNVHVVSWNFLGETWPFFRPNFRKMEDLLKKVSCDRVIGFVPTGWTYETKRKTFSVRKKGPLEIHLVPYSEHSNYDELRQYVAFLRPHEIIPTVGLEGGDMNSKAVAAMRKHFRNLVNETASKRRFLEGFNRKSGRFIEEKSPASDKLTLDLSKPDVTSDIGLQGLDLQTGSELLSCLDTPKAAFKKRAKKRQRESNKMDEAIESVSLTAKRGKASTEAKSLHVISSENESREIMGVSICSEGKEDQLRALLPKDITKKQVQDLLFKANKDLDLAVTLYFEGSFCTQQGPALSQKSKQKSLTENDVAKRALMARGLNAGTQSGVSEKEIAHSTTGNVNRKTVRSTVSVVNKRGVGSQASILAFFRKSDSSATLSTRLEKNCSCEVQFAKPMKTGDSEGNEGVVIGQNLERCVGLDQLLAILGAAVTEERARYLLEKFHGDIGAALDLYYKESSSSPLEADSEEIVTARKEVKCTEKNDASEMIEARFDKNLEAIESSSQQHLGLRDGEQLCRAVSSDVKNAYVAMSIWEYKPIEYGKNLARLCAKISILDLANVRKKRRPTGIFPEI